jgi:hypothetical protein
MWDTAGMSLTRWSVLAIGRRMSFLGVHISRMQARITEWCGVSAAVTLVDQPVITTEPNDGPLSAALA